MLWKLSLSLCLFWAQYLMFVHNELEVGSSWQHSQNLIIQQQSSYTHNLMPSHLVFEITFWKLPKAEQSRRPTALPWNKMQRVRISHGNQPLSSGATRQESSSSVRMVTTSTGKGQKCKSSPDANWKSGDDYHHAQHLLTFLKLPMEVMDRLSNRLGNAGCYRFFQKSISALPQDQDLYFPSCHGLTQPRACQFQF